MKDKLKKGQAFIGLDGNKYYFLGFDYDNQVFLLLMNYGKIRNILLKTIFLLKKF